MSRPVRLLAAVAGIASLLAVSVQSVAAIDPGFDVSVQTWDSSAGHAYVGVQAAGAVGTP